jgi:hypothetical protein
MSLLLIVADITLGPRDEFWLMRHSADSGKKLIVARLSHPRIQYPAVLWPGQANGYHDAGFPVSIGK